MITLYNASTEPEMVPGIVCLSPKQVGDCVSIIIRRQGSRTAEFSCEDCMSGSFRPVLKHGLRSLMRKHVTASTNPWHLQRICGKFVPLGFTRVRFAVHLSRPERWWTISSKIETGRNSSEGSERCWRANHSPKDYIGAIDSSNHLVAGSYRSFPQDSWPRCDVSCKDYDETCRSIHPDFLFQTLNGHLIVDFGRWCSWSPSVGLFW